VVDKVYKYFVVNKNKLILKLSVFLVLVSPFTYLNTLATEIEQSIEFELTNSNYPASFFSKYNPKNAFEMVERIPGFSFDGGTQARGFGGNAGNVLIDAARPTSKSGGLHSVLKRIPANQVIRIEIIRSGSIAAEAQGQSVVANIIRKQSGTSGTWASNLLQNGSSNAELTLEGTLSSQLGSWDTNLEVAIGNSPDYRRAKLESIKNIGNIEDIYSNATESLASVDRKFILAGEATNNFNLGKLALSARISNDKVKTNTQRSIVVLNPLLNEVTDFNWDLREIDDTDVGEFGIDWAQSIKDWKWRTVGLVSVEDRVYKNKTETHDFKEVFRRGDRYQQDYLSTEIIARSTLNKVSGSNFKPEFGFEIAKNQLETEYKFSEIDSPSNSNTVSGKIKVQELRGEIFANFNYAYNDFLKLEGGLTLELSNLDVSRDASAKNSFQFWKPRIAATYAIDDNSNINFEAVYRVSQLNFNDFAASNQASDQNVVSGNPNLEPDKRTDISLIYDWSFSERGSLKVEGFYSFRFDKLEQIVLYTDELGINHKGIGNLGNGLSWGTNTDLSLPLDYIIDNGLLEIRHMYFHSSLFDPMIGHHRKVTDSSPNWLFFKFRQDFIEHKFSWGFEYAGGSFNTVYRVDERVLTRSNSRFKLFAETSRFFGMKAKLEISDINHGHYKRTRYLYSKDRSGSVLGSEVSRQTQKPEIMLSISGAF